MTGKKTVRLQVFLSRNGVCSRRKAFDLVRAGRVMVNGEVMCEPSCPVDPDKDQVNANGVRVCAQMDVYLMMNKPWGVVTTRADRHAQKTVFDLLPAEYRGLHPVGRLDKNTEGLLLLTNDGDLTLQLTHPRYSVDKEYHVMIKGDVLERDLGRMEKGILLDDQKTAPAKVTHVRRLKGRTAFHLTIHEGRKRQIRRMAEALGYKVSYLKRLRQGGLSVGRLKPGEFRALSRREVGLLKKPGS